MCGIFGIVAERNALPGAIVKETTNDLFKLSESRGRESAGMAAISDNTISVYKRPVPASTMIKSHEYQSLLAQILSDSPQRAIVLMGHSRLVTNGSQENHENNQPVIKDGIVGIHNGIIVNDEALWQEFPALQRQYQVDTEVILSLIRHFYGQTGSLIEAVRSAFQQMRGTASIATLFTDLDVILFVTNNGSLYTCASTKEDAYVFASERYILEQLTKRSYLRGKFDKADIIQVQPGFGYLIDYSQMSTVKFTLTGSTPASSVSVSKSSSRAITDVTPQNQRLATRSSLATFSIVPESISKKYSVDTESIKALRRCTKCVLPETMPFIEFDDEGVCNYCLSYQKINLLDEKALLELADQYRSKDGSPDCIVMFSGGRDSSYCLHIVKTVLGMNPITYTYDWGMITDLARRNQARLCGKLGIEHILVSADINRKRENIRKNVTAWLKKPDLGMVPCSWLAISSTSTMPTSSGSRPELN